LQEQLGGRDILKSEFKKNSSRIFPMIGDVRGQGLFLGDRLVDAQRKPFSSHKTHTSQLE